MNKIYIEIYIYYKIIEIKTSFLSRNVQLQHFCRENIHMILRFSIAFEEFLGSSIVQQVMLPCHHTI